MPTLIEPEILTGQRAFADAQRAFAGAALRRLPASVEVGWHDTEVDPLMGSFAVVRAAAGLDDLIGEVLHLTAGTREVYVYVVGSRDVPRDISLARRAFFALGLLAREAIDCAVEVAE